MASCRSWRPRDPDSYDLGTPGQDRSKWARCSAKVDNDQVRCDECARLLAQHPDANVRRMLVAEQGLPVPVLQTLSSDPDRLISQAALDALAAMGLGQPGRAARNNPQGPPAHAGMRGVPGGTHQDW